MVCGLDQVLYRII